MKPHVKAQIAYLDLLKENGLLAQAMVGGLPDHVAKAARQVAASRFPDLPFNKDQGTIAVTAEEQDEVDREVEEYLLHYKLAVRGTLLPVLYMPREILKGKRYQVRRGSYRGKTILIRGTDREVFGLPWTDNFFDPACEGFVFRITRDKVPLNGRIFVGTIGREDVLLHENEIGELIQ